MRGLLNNACLGMHGLSRNVAPAFIAGIEASAGNRRDSVEHARVQNNRITRI